MSLFAASAMFYWLPRWFPALAPWLALVTVTLVVAVAVRQRWQRTPVLVRCVIFSLYAHIVFALLMMNAYQLGWTLKPPLGPGRGGREIHFQLATTADAVASDAPSENTTESIPEPWESPSEPPSLLNSSQSEAHSSSVEKITSEPVASSPLFAELPRMEVDTKSTPRADDKSSAALATVRELLAEVAPRYAEMIESPPRAETPTIPTPNSPQENTPPPAKTAPPKQAVANEHRAVPELYRLRFQHNAAQLAAAGGNADTEAAVQLALGWLAANQETDGRWSAAKHEAGRGNPQFGQERGGDTGADADTGITGLALLAFLGAGQTHLEGEHRVVVQHGLEFLLASQRTNGSLAGDAKLYASMYCHGMATFALAEAMAITRDQRLRPFVERAVAYSVAAQHARGGWRYQPGDLGDTSQFGWQVMALKSAEMADVTVPAITKERAQLFLTSVSSGRAGGLASYRPGERVSRTMTAEALLCRHLLGTRADAAVHAEATHLLLQELPSARATNIYYWYYGTLALKLTGGPAWQTWNEAMQSELLASQHQQGPIRGSWTPDSIWGSYGGRVFQTALSTLCLESYYRYDNATAK